MNSNRFNYKNYGPISDIDNLSIAELFTVLIALLGELEADNPGTIRHLVVQLSLIDGGFGMTSSVRPEDHVHAMRAQSNLMEVLFKEIAKARAEEDLLF